MYAHSPRILAANGFDAYCQDITTLGHGAKKKYTTQIRYLERDIGAVELQHKVNDRDALHRLLRFKAIRYAPNSGFPYWVGSTLSQLLTCHSEHLEVILSTLRAGHVEVASVLSLRSGRLLYYWFPAYDPAYRKYSPGMVALWLLIRDLPKLGCDRLDLGPGGEAYKDYFANAYLPVVSGRVDRSPLVASVRRLAQRAESGLRSNAIARGAVKPAVRWLRRMGKSSQDSN
jgi:CelD/BcsL family acetyltransferase involved in cellulose biosynthesis